MWVKAPWSVAVVGVSGAIAALLAGCTGGTMNAHPTLKPEEPKSRIQRLIDESTAALGGEWVAEEAQPSLGTCVNERGEGEGVNYTYIKRRAEHGNTERDIATLERLWQNDDLDTEQFKDGYGVTMGMNGWGAAAQVIEFYSIENGDSVSGTSWCAAGDYGEMRDRGEE